MMEIGRFPPLSPDREKRQHLVPIKSLKSLSGYKRFEFRGPYQTEGVQSLGEKQVLSENNRPALPIGSTELK